MNLRASVPAPQNHRGAQCSTTPQAPARARLLPAQLLASQPWASRSRAHERAGSRIARPAINQREALGGCSHWSEKWHTRGHLQQGLSRRCSTLLDKMRKHEAIGDRTGR